MKLSQIIIITLLSMVMAGCASSNSGEVYKREDARKVQTVKTGVLESIRVVRIEGTKSPIGSVAGSVIGGVAGSSAGKGNGRTIMAMLGSILGGITGSAIEEVVTREDGLELTVQLDGGGLITIVQSADDDTFTPGERVRIIETAQTSRVSH